MALQVWLPLIGDFHNQGLAGNIKFTATGTVSDEPSGKIGSCKKFDASNVIAPFNFTLGPELSACLWVKWTTFPGSSTNDWLLHLGSSSGYNNALLVLSNYHGTLLTVGVGGKYDSTYQHGFSTNEWHHIAFTWNGTIGKLYVDGDLKKSYTNLTGGTITSTTKISLGSNVVNSTTKLKGCLNDVRIYDHCLSAREVQEIAKGLVAHYPLNDPDLSSNKLYDCSGNSYHGTCTAASRPVLATDSPRRSRCVKFDTTAKYFQITNLPALGDIYTFSWWGWWLSASANIMFWGYQNGNKLNMFRNGVDKLYWNTGNGTDNPFYTSGTTIALAVCKGVWAHYVITSDGTTDKLYVNGELYATAKTHTAITGTTLFLNGWDTSTSYKGANTEISDFRLYATALSADQIKELYSNPISVCKSGNLMCMEVVE